MHFRWTLVCLWYHITVKFERVNYVQCRAWDYGVWSLDLGSWSSENGCCKNRKDTTNNSKQLFALKEFEMNMDYFRETKASMYGAIRLEEMFQAGLVL